MNPPLRRAGLHRTHSVRSNFAAEAIELADLVPANVITCHSGVDDPLSPCEFRNPAIRISKSF